MAEMTVSEAGKKGGDKRKATGADYATMGKKGGRTTAERYGPEHYEACGKKGGSACKRNHGPDYYSEIGKKGGQRVRELIQRGRAATGE